MAQLDVGTLSMTIEVDGRAAIQEINRVKEAAEGSATDAAKAYGQASDDMGGIFDPAKESAEDAGEAARRAGAETEKAAQSAGKTVRDSANKAESSVTKLGEKMTSVGKTMTTTLTLPIVGMYGAAVGIASDMTETLSKTDVVFGSMSEKVLAWSESSIQAMGLARGTALEMASLYGDMATGMGIGETAAAGMSMQLTQLAADLASFKNVGIGQVQTALAGVFTGETESLKQLGIVMTQANLQAYALSQGITTQISAMTQAEQVQLRYNYVLAQTAKAQGDFQRTGGSLANQQRKLTETIKQAGASYGELLVPLVTETVSSIQGWVQSIAELDDGTKNMILSVGAVVAATGPLLMAGGKVIQMIAALKAAMTALSLNPLLLGAAALTAAVVGVAALSSKLNSYGDTIDRASDKYQQLLGIVDDSITTKLSVDSSGIDSYNENPKTITVSADVQSALDAAQSVTDALTNGDYDGDLAIDGDPEAAETALQNLQSAIEAVKADITIGADGSAVLDPASGSVAQLKAAIDAVEGVVSITTDPEEKAALDAQLASLKTELSSLSASIGLSFTEDPAASTAMTSFKEKLDAMPKNEEYGGTGKFVISDMSAEAIEEYAKALAAAATATGDYKTAVESLNSIADQEAQRKIQEVQQQGNEAAMEQARLLNSGIIDEAQYDAAIEQIVNDMTAQIETIQAENEALKAANEVLADGNRANDYDAYGEGIKVAAQGQGVTETDMGTALNRLYETSTSGGNMTQLQVEGQTVLNSLLTESASDYATLTAAIETYQAAISKADMDEANANATYEKRAEVMDAMQEGIANYSGLVQQGYTGEQAVEQVTDNLSSTIEQYGIARDEFQNMLTEAMTGEDGGLMGNMDMDAIQAVYDTYGTMAEQELDASVQAAQAAREAAQTELQATVDSLNTGFNANELDVALNLAEQTGAQITEAQTQAITGGQQIISDLAGALSSGSGDIEGAISTAMSGLSSLSTGAQSDGSAIGTAYTGGIASGISSGSGPVQTAAGSAVQSLSAAGSTANSEGYGIGSNLMAGISSGIQSKVGTIAAAAAAGVRAAINAAKSEAQIASPSRKMRDEVGVMMMRGVGVGYELELPKALQVIRNSTMQLISGATSVVNEGTYTIPAYTMPTFAIDYTRMGEEMSAAMSSVNLSFGVGEHEMAVVMRDANARQQALRVQQINSGYGGRA